MALKTLPDHTIVGEGFTLTLENHRKAREQYVPRLEEVGPLAGTPAHCAIISIALSDALGWTTEQMEEAIDSNLDFTDLVYKTLWHVFRNANLPMPPQLHLMMALNTLERREQEDAANTTEEIK